VGIPPENEKGDAAMVAVTIDERFRIQIPKEARDGLKPGDTLFVVQEETEQGPVLHYARAINPFDALAEAALEEHRRGEMRTLEEFAAEHGIDLDADD